MIHVPGNPKCPVCDKLLDGATVADGGESALPSPGDITVCAGCFTCLRFTSDLQLVFQPLGELDEETVRTVVEARKALESFRRFMQ